MNLKKAAALSLAALISSLSVAACGAAPTDSPASTTAADAGDAVTIAEDTTTVMQNDLPDDLRFDGETINIWYFTKNSDVSESFIDMAGEQSGDIVEDAIYNRNLKTEERLGVKLNFVDNGVGSSDTGTEIRKLIMAGSTDYDFYNVVQWNTAKYVTEGLFMNMMNAPYIDIEKPWWATEYMKEFTVGNTSLYFLCGDIDIDMIRCIGCMYFNKQLYANYFGDPDEQYQLVLDGKWTIDALYERVAASYADLNGDNKPDVLDQYGLLLNNYNNCDIIFYGLGMRATGRDEEGMPVIVLNTERNAGAMEAMFHLIWENDGTRVGDPLPNTQDFNNGLSMYLMGFLYSSEFLRDMTQDYGIIPTVKLNEEQSQYYSVVHDIATLQCVPTTCTKLEAVSAVLEEMAYESYLSVTPSYYETALKTKYTRDNLSSQIIDLLHDTAMTDMAYIYQDAFSSVGYAGRNLIASKKSDLASWYAKKEKAALKNMQKLIDKYNEMG